jgi:hypothetical protein
MVEQSQPEESKNALTQKQEDEPEEDDEENLFVKGELVTCRFYRDEMPNEGDLVVVEIFSMEGAGAYVRLEEYNDLEAFLLYSEVSK